jgi:hypothetical protein
LLQAANFVLKYGRGEIAMPGNCNHAVNLYWIIQQIRASELTKGEEKKV